MINDRCRAAFPTLPGTHPDLEPVMRSQWLATDIDDNATGPDALDDWVPLVDQPPPLDWDLEDLFASPHPGLEQSPDHRSYPRSGADCRR